MKKVIFCFVGWVCWLGSSSQGVDRKFVEDWLLLFDSTTSFTNEVSYVIDGIPYAGTDVSLDKRLSQIPSTMVLGIVKKKSSNNRFPGNTKKEVITITLVKLQGRDVREDTLAAAKNMFMDKGNPANRGLGTKNPSLYVNGNLVDPLQAYRQIQSLTPYSIYAIERITSPAPVTIYGANAVNGVVRIWTRKYVVGR